jgi:type IV secretory pathway VirJ component
LIRIFIAAMASALLVTSGVQVPLDAAASTAPRESRYVLAPFGQVALYQPSGEPRATALFLSGDAGWNAGAAQMARDLARRGVLVAGVSTPMLMKALERGSARCINPNYPLVDLARDVEHRAGVYAYMKPVVIGYSAGATIAYAGLAQWPNGGYRGVFSLGFSADTTGHKPWCHAPGFRARAISRPAHGWLFAPSQRIRIPWVVLQGGQDKVVAFEPARRFVAAVPHARLIALPATSHDFADARQWMPQMASALAPMHNPVRRGTCRSASYPRPGTAARTI